MVRETDDGAVAQDAVLRLAGEGLGVEFFVDGVYELEADDAVVCGAVEEDGCFADGRLAVVEDGGLLGVEDFVDAVGFVSLGFALGRVGKGLEDGGTNNGESSQGRSALPLMIREV